MQKISRHNTCSVLESRSCHREPDLLHVRAVKPFACAMTRIYRASSSGTLEVIADSICAWFGALHCTQSYAGLGPRMDAATYTAWLASSQLPLQTIHIISFHAASRTQPMGMTHSSILALTCRSTFTRGWHCTMTCNPSLALLRPLNDTNLYPLQRYQRMDVPERHKSQPDMQAAQVAVGWRPF